MMTKSQNCLFERNNIVHWFGVYGNVFDRHGPRDDPCGAECLLHHIDKAPKDDGDIPDRFLDWVRTQDDSLFPGTEIPRGGQTWMKLEQRKQSWPEILQRYSEWLNAYCSELEEQEASLVEASQMAVGETQADEVQTQETQADETQADEVQPDEVQPEEVQPEATQPIDSMELEMAPTQEISQQIMSSTSLASSTLVDEVLQDLQSKLDAKLKEREAMIEESKDFKVKRHSANSGQRIEPLSLEEELEKNARAKKFNKLQGEIEELEHAIERQRIRIKRKSNNKRKETNPVEEESVNKKAREEEVPAEVPAEVPVPEVKVVEEDKDKIMYAEMAERKRIRMAARAAAALAESNSLAASIETTQVLDLEASISEKLSNIDSAPDSPTAAMEKPALMSEISEQDISRFFEADFQDVIKSILRKRCYLLVQQVIFLRWNKGNIADDVPSSSITTAMVLFSDGSVQFLSNAGQHYFFEVCPPPPANATSVVESGEKNDTYGWLTLMKADKTPKHSIFEQEPFEWDYVGSFNILLKKISEDQNPKGLELKRNPKFKKSNWIVDFAGKNMPNNPVRGILSRY